MRVFISGVSRTFATHREAVADKLREYGIDPVQQKEFPPTFETITVMLRKKVRSCNAVICLVGPAYGCAPDGQVAHPKRSYTQIEYDVARELQIPIYVFEPAESCPLDPQPQDTKEHDTAEQLTWQKAFRVCLRQAEKLVWEYRTKEDLQAQVARIVPEVADVAVQTVIRMHYPTPLAQLYGKCFHEKDQKPDIGDFSDLLAGTLRLLSLLAIGDAVASEIFGSGYADLELIVRQCVLGEIGVTTWHSLLRLACAAVPGLARPRVVEEFQGWEDIHRGTLGELVRNFQFLDPRRPKRDRGIAVDALRGLLPILFKAMDFLTRYAIVGVATVPPEGAAPCRAWVFRGEHPSEVALIADVPIRSGDLYLLSLNRREALLLDPGLRFQAGKIPPELGGISALEFERDDGGVTYESFVERECFTAAGTPLPSRELFARWLGPTLASSLFTIDSPARALKAPSRIFDEGSWQRIQNLCLPEERGELMFAGGHRLPPHPLHRGRYADLYETDSESDQDGGRAPDLPVIHVLREDSSGDPDVRAWFLSRCETWQVLRHPSVVPLLSHSKPLAGGEKASSEASDAGGGERPWLAAQLIADATTLEAKLKTGGATSVELCRSVVETAAEVCLEAQRHRIYLMDLAPHHFLLDRQHGIHLTGFEAALSETNPLWKRMTAPEYFSKFTSQRNSIDPAVLSGRMQPGPLADVYALGVLLAALRGLPGQAAESLPASAWRDPWQCLTFHALAARPNLRFQGPDHFLRALREWLKRAPGGPPELVHVPAGHLAASVGGADRPQVPGFWIGKYPVTNAEYAFFCMERRLHLPYHLEGEGARGHDQLNLAGPWCPVTNVCLDHAEQYCAWLSQRTGRRWRLPRETEWQRAAVLEDASPYPWGSAEPSRTHANYDRFLTSPTVVGAFPDGRSAVGCYDIAGNVWEWSSDFVSDHEPLRVLKGGAYDFSANCLKVTYRQGVVALYRSAHVGFRVLCEEKS